MRSSEPPARRRYVSASELADYAFCPRSHFYRQLPDGRRPADGSVARERAGEVYHLRTIGSDRRWSDASPLPWIGAVVVGLALLAFVLVTTLGGVP